MIGIDTKEVADLKARLGRSETALDAAVDDATKLIAHGVLTAARRKVPRGRSGNARASLRLVGSSGTQTITGGGQKAPYYAWLDFGGRTGIRNSVHRTYKRGGRYIFPGLVSQSAEIAQALDRAVDDALRAGGLDG